MSQSRMQSARTLYMLRLTMLLALLILMDVSGIGYIKLPGLDLTLMTVPVLVGAIVLGPGAGAAMGLAFGMTSFLQAVTGKSPFAAMLFSYNPFYTFITAVPTRVLMGWLCALIFLAMKKRVKNAAVTYTVASLSAALLNTILFMSCFLLLFYNAPGVLTFREQLGTANPLAFAIAFVGWQALVEAAICAVLGAVIARGLVSALKL